MDNESRKQLEKRNKLNTCYFLAYTPILKYTLGYLLCKVNTFEKYSKIIKQCIGQLLPVIINLHKNGYSHSDLHPDNIMYDKHWYIIDYGTINHEKLIFTKEKSIEKFKYPQIDSVTM